jgi:hypothetical protein
VLGPTWRDRARRLRPGEAPLAWRHGEQRRPAQMGRSTHGRGDGGGKDVTRIGSSSSEVKKEGAAAPVLNGAKGAQGGRMLEKWIHIWMRKRTEGGREKKRMRALVPNGAVPSA